MQPAISSNIASALPAMAQARPFAMAVVYPEGHDREGRVCYTHLTYQQLDDESSRLAAGLKSIGIDRGVHTVLMVKPSLEFFALTFALFKLAAVPILIDPGMGVRNLGKCLEEAEPKAFIGIPKAHIARRILKWGKNTIKTNITVGRRGPWEGFDLHQIRSFGNANHMSVAEVKEDETAAILFTSGSTGPPKGAIYTHGIFTSQVRILRDLYQIEPGEIDLATFPLFALFAPALGMTAIVPDMDATRPAQVNSKKIFEAIDNFGVTNMFGSPALLDRVGRDAEAAGKTFPSLRRVLSAGAPVRAHVIARFQKTLAPGVQIYTPYGATESLPVASVGSETILGETQTLTSQGAGVCLGKPVSSATAHVIKISDGPILTWSDDLIVAPGEIGEISVKGPTVTRAYYRRDEATKLAKIVDPAGGFYHRMGDLGYFDQQGRLWFCGRKTQRVTTTTGTLFTIPCEAIFNNHPAVARSALVGIGPFGQQKPVICIELKAESKNVDQKKTRAELLELGALSPHTKTIQNLLFHPGFPVDIRHNAKIFREKLAVWAAGKIR
jgi:acyl-CoA synthetase (AMP-forming)/AMP-acid ligase II